MATRKNYRCITVKDAVYRTALVRRKQRGNRSVAELVTELILEDAKKDARVFVGLGEK